MRGRINLSLIKKLNARKRRDEIRAATRLGKQRVKVIEAAEKNYAEPWQVLKVEYAPNQTLTRIVRGIYRLEPWFPVKVGQAFATLINR